MSMKLTINISKRNKIILIIMPIALFFFIFKAVEFIKIDNCLDTGGRWNYEKSKCENK